MIFRERTLCQPCLDAALVVALGGTSYAAVAIPKNSVGSKEIITASVKSADARQARLERGRRKSGRFRPDRPDRARAAGAAGAVGPQDLSAPHGPRPTPAPTSSRDMGAQTVQRLGLPTGNYVLAGTRPAARPRAASSGEDASRGPS